jgi:hypothetical protein
MADLNPVPEPPKDPTITDESEDEAHADENGRASGGVADMVRRAVMAGVGAVFLTEEGIRKTVSELKLPKEAFGYLSTTAEKTRLEGARIVRKELRRFLNSEAFKDQMLQALSGLTLEIKAEVRVKPSINGPKPDLSAKFRVKQTDSDEKPK